MRQGSAILIRPRLLRQANIAELFGYQREGVEWLSEQRSAILADDMGLGKTVQAIAAVRQLVNEGTARWALVICPRSLMATWESEIVRWAPELTRIRLTPSAGVREAAWRMMLGRVHIVLTNYEHLRAPPKSLLEREVPIIIADEAHRIRNVGAQSTAGIRRLRFHRFWALPGTPIERDAVDMATLLSLIEPQRFAPDDARLPASVLRGRAKPLMLRRRKEEVLAELPEVLERNEILELLGEQQRTYDRVLKGVRPGASSDHTLAVLTELRQICDVDPESGGELKGRPNRRNSRGGSSARGEGGCVFNYDCAPRDSP